MTDHPHKGKNVRFLDQRVVYGAAVVVAIVFAYGGYSLYTVQKKLKLTTSEFASSTAAFEAQVQGLEHELVQATETNRSLIVYLQKERENVEVLSNNLAEVTGKVSTLEKLSRTDTELLQKYSRVFFLNENYVPEKLTTIFSQFILDPEKPQQIHTDVWPHLQRMLEHASANGTPLKVVSGFRSFEEQTTLKQGYKVVFGSGANKFSADQGYSEHQLGTTVDLTVLGSTPLTSEFEDTASFRWLQNNAHKYGFILSYPKNNTFYEYEPWHWRFVGVKLATRLHTEGKSFYDLDQREIDTYLIDFFE